MPHPKTLVWKKPEKKPIAEVAAEAFVKGIKQEPMFENEFQLQPIAITHEGPVEVVVEMKDGLIGHLLEDKKVETLRALRHSIYDFCKSQGMTGMEVSERNRGLLCEHLKKYAVAYSEEMHRQLKAYWKKDADKAAQRKRSLELNAQRKTNTNV